MTIWFKEIGYPSNLFFQQHLLAENHEFLKPVFEFANFYFSGKDTFEVKTSGSTGTPSKILLHRNQIETSARTSIDFFGLDKNEVGLILCIPANHIGGIMVLARSFLAGIDLWIVEPSSNGLPENSELLNKKKWFISMVPRQLDAVVENNKINRYSKNWKGILVGGAEISKKTQGKIQELNCPVFQSYGMTETASHIAIKNHYLPNQNLKPEEIPFQILPGIQIKTEENGCLSILGKVTQNVWLQTKDTVNLVSENSFFLAGRMDDIINSDGLKINPESVKTIIFNYLPWKSINFELVGIHNSVFGEVLVMVFESNKTMIPDGEGFWSGFMANIRQNEDPKILPKAIYEIEKIPVTASLKVDKPALKTLLEKILPIWKKQF